MQAVSTRPFWQIKGECIGAPGACLTLLSTDPYWDSPQAPWNCDKDCDCRVHSLSRVEMERYMQTKQINDDPNAVKQYELWMQQSGYADWPIKVAVMRG